LIAYRLIQVELIFALGGWKPHLHVVQLARKRAATNSVMGMISFVLICFYLVASDSLLVSYCKYNNDSSCCQSTMAISSVNNLFFNGQMELTSLISDSHPSAD